MNQIQHHLNYINTHPQSNRQLLQKQYAKNQFTRQLLSRKRLAHIKHSSVENQKADTQNKRSLSEKLIGLGNPVGPSSFVMNKETQYDDDVSDEIGRMESISSMTTEEWQQQHLKDGTVDLWLEDEFNAGSRLKGGRVVHKGGVYGQGSGEGPTQGLVAKHTVKIFNHYQNQQYEVEVPEDRYVLWEAEDAGMELPYACRMGCCTACAVRVKKGEMYQPQALGISAELKAKGYALMCVGYPRSDLELETVPEDEVYDLQFGYNFAVNALSPVLSNVDRDDFALEIANMDE